MLARRSGCAALLRRSAALAARALAAAVAPLAADLGHVVAVGADGLAAFPADVGHVVAVLADRLAALAAGRAGLVGGEAVGHAAGVGSGATEAGDLALLLGAHGGEAAPAW